MFTVQLKLFFTLLSAIFFQLPITQTFFNFPWKFELLVVDCKLFSKQGERRILPKITFL